MSYVDKVLQPGEQVIHKGRLHWIIYVGAWSLMVIGIGLAAIPFIWRPDVEYGSEGLWLAALVIISIGIIQFVRAAFRQWTTEIAVTDRRVIYKTGWVRRDTLEMNMARVETVVVEQSILARLLNYGTVHVRGTGVGIENLKLVAAPLELRNAISAQ